MSHNTVIDPRHWEGEQYRLLAENMRDYAIFILDPDGRVQSWGAGAERLFGYTEAQITGRHVELLYAAEDQRAGHPERNLEAARVQGTFRDTSSRVRKDASRFIADVALVALYDEGGRLRGFGNVTRDLSELRQNEARKSAILDTALDCIILIDAAGCVLEFNPAAERTFGYRRADVVGRELAELIVPPALRERHRAGLARYVATGEGPVLGKRIELPGMRADGSEFPVELAITRIPGEGPPQFAAYLRDISERQRAEQLRSVRMAVTHQLAQAQDMSEASAHLLQAVCENLGWDIGLFWVVDPAAEALRCLANWHRPGTAFLNFVDASRTRTFRKGEGLPGRAWSSGSCEWVGDVRTSPEFARAAPAATDGLQSAFACPVTLYGSTLGVMEFFTRRMREPEDELLETITTIAGQIGQFIERRQTEQTLRESEGRFRGLMEQAPFSVQILAPDGSTLAVNRAWSQVWGVTLEQIAGYNVLEDPQLEAKGVLGYLRRAFAGESVAVPEIRYDPNETIPDITNREDAARWVAAVAYPLKDDAGRVREVVLSHNDVTARRQAEMALRASEEKLRLLADTIPQLAWMAQPDGGIFWYNRRWYDYTGTDLAGMEGWGWQSVHDPEILPEVIERWSSSIAGGVPFEMVFPLKGADGQFRPFLTRVNPLRDEDGNIVYWFGTNTDISEIKRMEDALRDTDRRKDEFLATLAHELRNPLAPIRNSLQILKLPNLDPATAEKSRAVMERQVHHLVRLVDDLLDVSRVVRGKIELRKEAVELATIVARAVEIAQPLIEVQGHRLDIALPAQSLLIDGDPVRLAQVMGNLLTNAGKYTEANGSISFSAQREGNEALVRLVDTGIGIAPDMLPHVFELFVQGDHSEARSQGGLGIGLTLVKNLIELHGGSVSAWSAGLGRGSEFTIRLPLLPDRQAQVPVAHAPGQTPAVAAGHRLLVVDDNRDAAESLAILLRAQGYAVRVAFDGAAGLEQARIQRPELVFLDIGMPGMDGYEVARRLRATPGLEKVVLVALTGWGQKSDRLRSAEAGFDRHLVKPLEEKALKEVLAGLAPAPA